MVESDRLTKMTEGLKDETGLCCIICHEGWRTAPHESLGVYVYVVRNRIEDQIKINDLDIGSQTSTVESSTNANHSIVIAVPSNVDYGYSTSSNFVVVHFSCHKKVSWSLFAIKILFDFD